MQENWWSDWGKISDFIKKLPKRVRALLGAEWAKHSLPIWFRHSSDRRPALAIEACLAWVFSPSEANREAIVQASHNIDVAAHDGDMGVAAKVTCAANACYCAASAHYDAGDVTVAYAAARYVDTCYYVVNAFGDETKWHWIEAVYKRCAGPNYTFASEWRTTEAVALAQGMWSRGVCDCLPILADALQEAGLDDQKVLAPLRFEPSTSCLSDWTMWNLLQFDN